MKLKWKAVTKQLERLAEKLNLAKEVQLACDS